MIKPRRELDLAYTRKDGMRDWVSRIKTIPEGKKMLKSGKYKEAVLYLEYLDKWGDPIESKSRSWIMSDGKIKEI